MTMRVLVYSPYGNWDFHTMYDITIAHGLRMREVDVKLICCDGCYSDCDVHWQATEPRQPDSCQQCANKSEKICNGMQMPFDWFSQHLPDNVMEEALSWVNSIPDAQLFDAKFNGYQLGQWAKSSVHSHFRMNTLDLDEPQINQAYRSYLASTYIALIGAAKVLDDFKPEALVMLNGRFFSHRVFFELAQQRGIRILVHERGARDNSLRFWENENCHSYQTFKNLWHQWKDVPLDQKQVDDVNHILEEREHGRNTGWRSFASPKQVLAELKEKLSINVDNPVITLFTSSDDEVASSEGWETTMDQLEWMSRTISFFRERKNYTLVIRIHPNITGITGSNKQFLQRFDDLICKGIPDNVCIIAAEDKVNSYQLMDISERCIVFSSTVSIEAVTKAKPVLMTGGGLLFGNEYSHNLSPTDRYEEILEKFLLEDIQESEVSYALRFAYHLFYRYSTDFPLVDASEIFVARNTYETLEELSPGNDDVLDRVCDYLLKGDPIYAGPVKTIEISSEDEKKEIARRFSTQLHACKKEDNQTFEYEFSVIIPTYNRCEILKKCLDSLSEQTISKDKFEVIVCDDGSQDNTLKLIQEYAAPFNLHCLTQENSGPAKARNMGIRVAKGEYLLIMNDDAIADKNLLENHASEHRKLASTQSAVLGSFAFLPEYTQVPYGYLLENSDLLFYFGKMSSGKFYDYNHFYTCNISIRKQAVIDTGLFDEEFHVPAAEDIELGYRLQQAGYRVYYAPHCKAWHDHEISVKGFCKVQEVRGLGAGILYKKYPHLSPIEGGYKDYYQNWKKEGKIDLQVIEKIILQLENIGKSIKDGDIAAIKKITTMMYDTSQILSHYYWMKGLVCYQEGVQKNNATLKIEEPDKMKDQVKPLVSVVVTCYNYGQYIEEAVNSVLNQTYQHFELIIVNDGSTDDSLIKIKQLIATNQKKKIILVDQANSGQPAISRNNGIKQARGQYILCLDADDMLAPDILLDTVSLLNENSEIAIAYTDRHDFDGVDQVVYAAEFDPQKLRYQNQISYCALYRKEVWESIGGYRTNVRGLEDWDFWIAAAARGFKATRIPKPHLLYRRHDTGLFQDALNNQQQRIAQIFVNNSEMYSSQEVAEARSVLDTTGEKQAVESIQKKQNDNPLVSIIVPTYNRPELLINALNSIVRQDYPNWQALVVNDAGEDVEKIALSADPKGRVIYQCHPVNKGLPAARNTGLRKSSGEVICYLDDDDEFLEDHLSTIVSALNECKELLVYTDAEYVYKDCDDKSSKVLGTDERYKDMEYSRSTLLANNYIPVNSIAHRRELLGRCGYFDESFSAFEDWELWLRYSEVTDFYHIHKSTVCVIQSSAESSMLFRQKRNYPALIKRLFSMYPVDSADIKNARNLVLLNAKAELAALRMAGADDGSETEEQQYEDWIELHKLSQLDVDLMLYRLDSAESKPGIHILVVLEKGNSEQLSKVMNTLSTQIYEEWGLSILSVDPKPDIPLMQLEMIEWVNYSGNVNNAINNEVSRVSGDWVCLLSPDDLLEPQALLQCADYANKMSSWKFIYADHDVVDEKNTRKNPYFKPDFSLDLLRSVNFIGTFALINREAFEDVAGYQGLEELTHFDLAFKISQKFGDSSIGHIEDILSHQSCLRTYQHDKQEAIIQADFTRRGIHAKFGASFQSNAFNIEYIHAETPKVSIIIPTKDKLEYLQPCLDSVLDRTSYSNVEIIIVDNNSDDQDLDNYLESVKNQHHSSVKVLKWNKPFNYSALMNDAVEAANGEYCLFLHNDTLIIQNEWLSRMMGLAQRLDIGIVGARLLLPGKGKLQHAGYVLGKSSAVDSFYASSIDHKDSGYQGMAHVCQEVSAVSSACMLVRKSMFTEINGFDQEAFSISFNDVDLCMRARKQGAKVVWTPYASVLHHGGVSIGGDKTSALSQAHAVIEYEDNLNTFYQRYNDELGTDRFFSKHLSLVSNVVTVENQVVCNWDTNFNDKQRVYGVPLSGGAGEYRIKAPFRMLERNGICQTDFSSSRKINVQRFPSMPELKRLDPHAVLFHSPIANEPIMALSHYKKYMDVNIILTMDDLITDLPDDNPFKKIAPRDARSRLLKALSFADRLIVTTEPLRAYCENMVDDIHIVPNYLENEIWDNLSSKRAVSSKPRVGWAGAQQHGGDLEFILDIVKETANEIDWVFFGMCPEAIKDYVAEEHEFEMLFTDYATKLASLDLDLAIAPLEIHPFNEAKSNLRLLEYGVLGWPVICTDIYPYQNSPATCLKNDKQVWLTAIRERIHDLDALYKEGDILQEWVRNNYMLNDHADNWKNAILGTSFSKEQIISQVATNRK